MGGIVMDEFVARLNVTHYREALANETDEAKRKTIETLLANEELKLAAMKEADKKRQAASLVVHSPKHFLFCAEEIRTLADDMKNTAAKSKMLRLAEDYDRLAKFALQRQESDRRLIATELVQQLREAGINCQLRDSSQIRQ